MRDHALARRLRLVGDVLRAERERIGWSQEHLADVSGLHRTYVGSVERGERNVTLASLWRLAEALDVPAARILERAEEALS